MQWKCPHQNPFDGKTHIALVHVDSGEPKVIGCLECDWRSVVKDNLLRDDDEIAERYLRRESRCVAANQMGGSRCSLPVDRGALCARHGDRTEKWDRIYGSFKSPWSDIRLPEAYREVFIRAIHDADLVADAQQVTRETFEEAQRLRHASVVYFVEREGFIKIGTTSSLRTRLTSLSQGACKMPEGMKAGPVTLLATTLGDHRTESRFHARFQKQRVAGEWFRPNKALLRLVDDLHRAEHNGTPDILDQALEGVG